MALDVIDQPTTVQIERLKKTPMQALRIEWALISAFSLSFLTVGFVILSVTWQLDLAGRWLILPSLVVAYLLRVLWQNLGANHREGEPDLLPDLGWGNRLTLLRGVLVAGMMGFLLLPRPGGWLIWIPGVLYTLSDAADFFDGYVARVTNRATRLGKILDVSFDGLGVLAASLLVVLYGQAPAWYILVGLARYLFLAGEWLRRRLGKPIYPIPPSLNRRVFAGLQMGFLAAALLPLIPPPGIHIAATLFGLPLLVGFGRDWLYVSGVLKPNSEHSSRLQARVERWLPAGLRILILVLNLGLFVPWMTVLQSGSFAFGFIGLLYWLAVGMLVLGVLPRVTSIVALFGLGFAQLLAPLSPIQIALGVAYILILYIGSGAFSLWAPEDYLYRNHAGGRPAVKVGQGI
jgi:CDP-diacylglycerol--glycerol-3-phosphate 3-phosphatidyltransferase